MASQVSFCRATAARRKISVSQAAWFTTGLTSLSAAAGAWWDHGHAEPSFYRTAAGAMLLAMAGWQWALARQAAGGGDRRGAARMPWKPAAGGQTSKTSSTRQDAGWKPAARTGAGWKPTLRGVMCSLAVSYGICLWIGNEPGVGWMFLACLFGCFTAALVHSSGRRAGEPAARWGARRRAVELAGNCACWLAVGLILCEAGLRLAESLSGPRWPDGRTSAWSVESGDQRKGEGGETQQAGQFRVAVLGDAQTLANNEGTSCLAQLEDRLPGIEVCTFAKANRGEHSAVAEQLARFRPDVVVTFLSVGDDILGGISRPGAFDWRNLRLAALLSAWRIGDSPARSKQSDSRADDYETFLRSISGQLTVCRTPIGGDDERRWRETLGDLSELVEQCRRRDLPIALVLVPSQLQVKPLICEALRRRAGYEASQVDLELPQRRLARFADEHQVPVLDLLPHFRASREELFRRHQGALSQQGHDLAGDLIGSWLRRHYAAGRTRERGSDASGETQAATAVLMADG